MRSIVTKHRMYPVRHGGCEVPQDVAGLHGERPSRAALRTRTWTFDRCHKQVELALLGPDLGDVDVKEADGIALEPGPLGPVALRVGQARDTMPLKAAMQG